MSSKRLLLVLALVCPSIFLFSQTPSYHHYSSADGLASSVVYEIIQDSEGFIWFATANGISRFDGSHFKTFRTRDGLNSNSNTSIVEGKNGELYIGNYEKGINVMRKGKIEPFCNEIEGERISVTFLLLTHSVNEDQKLYAYRPWGPVATIHERSSQLLNSHIIPVSSNYLNKLGELTNGELVALTTKGLYRLAGDTLKKIQIEGLPDQPLYCLSTGSGSEFLTGTRGFIYKIHNDRIVHTYKIAFAGDNDVSAILEDRNGSIWFSIMNRGFYCIPDGSNEIIDMGSRIGLQNSNVNNYLEDSEGNIWVSTYGKGVFCLTNMFLKTLDETHGLSSNCVYALQGDMYGNLLAGTFNGLDILKNGRFIQIRSDSSKTLTEYIHGIKRFHNEFYISRGFSGDQNSTITENGLTLHMMDHLSFCLTDDGWYYFGMGFNGIFASRYLSSIESQSKLFHVFGDSIHMNRINEIFEDSEGRLWIGTALGLCRVDDRADTTHNGEWVRHFYPEDPVLSARINSILETPGSKMWFAGAKGVATINPETGSFSSFTLIDGYDLSSSTSLALDNQKRLWIGTMTGLYLVDGERVKVLNTTSGLPSDEVHSLYYNSGSNVLYAGTSNGICLLDVSLFDNYHPSAPRVRITGIMAGDSVFTTYSNMVMNPSQRNLFIDYKGLHFSSPGSVKYRYKFDKEWVSTDHDFLNLIALTQGTYTLQIMARAQNTGWGEPVILSFTVLPEFVETIWFRLLIVLILLLIVLFLMWWRQRIYTHETRKSRELAERFNQLKHQALSAMMNPHFISNSLNSVQYLVNSGKYEDANNYIAMMANLMRKNLDTAGSGFIRLSEEILRLQLYLDLEKLRLQEKFSYTIIVGSDIDCDSVMIPNMIIQPFVENSIWHGIMYSGNKGILTVSFNFEEVDIDSFIGRSLIIKVTDNGIGMKEATKNKKEDHISKGILIIEERLRLLSTKMHLPHPIIFEDISSQDNTAHGTEVIISLSPPLYQIPLPGSDSFSSPAD
ncbi:MAG: histidine kinase [Bacteroidales bacterium]|nr:histidine kinase [Bacteroidales bacterium]